MAGKIFKVRFKESSILSVAYGESSQQFSESSSVRNKASKDDERAMYIRI